MIYTVVVTVEVAAESGPEARDVIHGALNAAKQAEIVILGQSVIREQPEDDDASPQGDGDPREKGDDDGVEYADPRDEQLDRLLRD